MFRKEKRSEAVKVSLSDESMQAIQDLAHEVGGLLELTLDVSKDLKQLTRVLLQETQAQLNVLARDGEHVDVAVFEDDETEASTPHPLKEDHEDDLHRDMPYRPMEFSNLIEDEGRVRATPFARTTRGTQINWILRVLADGEWWTAKGMAWKYAYPKEDYKARRYMSHAVGSKLRELWEEGKIERRDSRTPGAMYEYRLNVKEDV